MEQLTPSDRLRLDERMSISYAITAGVIGVVYSLTAYSPFLLALAVALLLTVGHIVDYVLTRERNS